ncbi:MAG: response regulator [Bacteriovorax sp.]|nr:response regulator [Bacteriovorax sp.]
MAKVKEVKDLKVMVVDDISSFRDIITKILTELGIILIVEASTGLEAWEKIALESKGVEKFDLVISDINMPKMSGMDLLKNIREFNRTAKLPFILVSTESEQHIILQALQLEISDYLLKPYDRELAIKKLKKVLTKIIYA